MPPKKKAKVDPSRISSDDGNLEPSSSDKITDDNFKLNRKKAVSTHVGNNKFNQVLQNKTSTEFHEQDFGNVSETPDGRSWNLKIATWNVDGLRAWVKVSVHLPT